MIDPVCTSIVDGLGVKVFVETGTDMGETVAEVACWFAERDAAFGRIADFHEPGYKSYNPWNAPIRYPRFDQAGSSEFELHSVDVDAKSVAIARRLFESNPNIHIHEGSSEQWLRRFVDERKASGDERRVLFFLDAHWGAYWPLRDELQAIVELERFAVVIDDFMVPGKSDPKAPHGAFGFDLYKGRVLNWPYVRDCFAERDVGIYYPTAPNRDRRGWVLIVSGYSEEELQFLNNLPLFRVEADDPVHDLPAKPHPRAYLDWKNAVKTVVPLRLVRSMIRGYQTVRFRKRAP